MDINVVLKLPGVARNNLSPRLAGMLGYALINSEGLFLGESVYYVGHGFLYN